MQIIMKVNSDKTDQPVQLNKSIKSVSPTFFHNNEFF